MITDYSNYLTDLLAAQLKRGTFACTRLTQSRLLVEISFRKKVLRFRVLAFALGGTGRHRPNERRLQITSTYEQALDPISGVTDLVIGVDRSSGQLVGVDADRLNFGGPTSNASTFVYTPGFRALKLKPYDIRLTPSRLIDDEKQVYMRPEFLSQYILGARGFHKVGVSTETGPPPSDTTPEKPGIKLSFEDQLKLALHKMEIGKRGEQHVFEREVAKLLKKDKALADKVEWTSQTYPYRGYDIASFNDDESPVYIEVKASSGALSAFHFTENEYVTASRLKNSYEIVCVSRALSSTPEFRRLRNPVSLITEGRLRFTRDGLVVYV